MKREVSWPGWETVGRIGSGGFGTVYKIQQHIPGYLEEAALKVITIPHNEDEIDYLRCSGLTDANITQTLYKKVESIAKEYSLMAQMRDNPNVVRCDGYLEIKHDDGLGWDIYIKMELLTPLMKCHGKVQTENQIRRLGMDICNALVACQEKNIIHRDIKPQNIFISDKGHFKLGDFGIARTAERTTRATAGIGTYSYMAPEVEKSEAYGKTADIYSLGLVLYWLLNERRSPFMPLPPAVPGYGDEENARNRRFRGEQIPAPKNGSDALKAIVLKACAYDPKTRYQSAQEMLAALEAVQAGKESEIVPIVANDPVSKIVADEEDMTVGPGWDTGKEETVIEETGTVGPGWGKVEDEPIGEDNTVGPVWGKIIEHNTTKEQTEQLVKVSDISKQNNIAPETEAYTPEKKRGFKRFWLIPVAMMLLLTVVCIGLLSRNGVKQTGWQEIDGNIYYFDANGVKQTGWHGIGGNTYCFDANGGMQTGWYEVTSQIVYRDDVAGKRFAFPGMYYFGSDGVMLIGAHNVDGVECYFGSGGALLSIENETQDG